MFVTILRFSCLDVTYLINIFRDRHLKWLLAPQKKGITRFVTDYNDVDHLTCHKLFSWSMIFFGNHRSHLLEISNRVWRLWIMAIILRSKVTHSIPVNAFFWAPKVTYLMSIKKVTSQGNLKHCHISKWPREMSQGGVTRIRIPPSLYSVQWTPPNWWDGRGRMLQC